jgi:nucleotide-binding universal stress UspA family protein
MMLVIEPDQENLRMLREYFAPIHGRALFAPATVSRSRAVCGGIAVAIAEGPGRQAAHSWRSSPAEDALMIGLRTVLVAMDFSEAAHAALARARTLAARFDASLHVFYVVTEPLREPWSGYVPAAQFIETVERLQADAERRLSTLLSMEEPSGLQLVVATAWGEPSEQILKYAEAHGVDLIVCGTHGRCGWNRVLMGSVAERVARLARCPVLTVHADGTAANAA